MHNVTVTEAGDWLCHIICARGIGLEEASDSSGSEESIIWYADYRTGDKRMEELRRGE